MIITTNRLYLMKRAVLCFNNQIYPNKELVVIDDGNQDLNEALQLISAEQLLYKKVPPKENTLGKLRNISL